MDTLSARFGLLSPDDIACNRFDARGDMLMCIGLPDSSLRGFCIACACWAAERSVEVASDRLTMRWDGTLGVLASGAREGLKICRELAGMRKSR
jgi:hypothetical protein